MVEGMRLKTQKCEMAKRHKTSWAQPSKEMSTSPETMLSQLSRNRENRLFKTFHHGATNTIGVFWLWESFYTKRYAIFYSLDDFSSFCLKRKYMFLVGIVGH